MAALAQLNLYLDTYADCVLPLTLLAGGATSVGLSVASAQLTLRVTPIDATPLLQATVANGQLAFGVAPPPPVGAQCANIAELEAQLAQGPLTTQTLPPGPIALTVASLAALEAALTGGLVTCTLGLNAADAPYPAGSLLANVVGQAGQTYKNTTTVTAGQISGGVATGIVFEATTPGPVPAVAAGTLATIATPVTGWSSITNPAASSATGYSVGQFAFVTTGAGAYYAWSPADTNAPSPPQVVPATDGLGNWLFAPTCQVSIPLASLAPLVGIAQGSWDMLVTFTQGGTAKVWEGTWYAEQSTSGH